MSAKKRVPKNPKAVPISPLVTSSKNSFSPVELAQLAATIDPAACKTDDPTDAVIKAVELLEKCRLTCRALMIEGSNEQARVIDDNLPKASEFARKVGRWLSERAIDAWEKLPGLTLALRDSQPDTLRPYLAERANFEGKKGERKAWSQVRTVLTNLRAHFIAAANRHNLENADQLRSAIERLREQPGQPSGPPPSWEDGNEEYEAHLKTWERRNAGALTHYEIPYWAADGLISWKRAVRQQPGGVKSVRPLTLEEVIWEGSKKKIPNLRR